MKKIFSFSILFFFLGYTALAQHEHHTMPDTMRMKKPTNDTMMMHHNNTKDDTMKMMHHDMDMGNMSHSFSLNLPMNRNGSGTGWLPDASPMYGYMMHSRKWMYMAHGSVFLRYNNQDFNNKGIRGDSRFDAPTWFMLMGQRKVGHKGLFHFNTMLSLDPMIEGGKGYPLLFQT